MIIYWMPRGRGSDVVTVTVVFYTTHYYSPRLRTIIIPITDIEPSFIQGSPDVFINSISDIKLVLESELWAASPARAVSYCCCKAGLMCWPEPRSATNPWSWLFNSVCTKHLVFHIFSGIWITLATSSTIPYHVTISQLAGKYPQERKKAYIDSLKS